MKTIIVIYTNVLITDNQEIAKRKKYSFNTKSELKEGDMIHSSTYSNDMQVIKVLDSAYTYYNSNTGELSNEYNSTAQWEIREMIIRDEQQNVVYGSIVNAN